MRTNQRILFFATAIAVAACASGGSHPQPMTSILTIGSPDVRAILKNAFPSVAPLTIDRLTEIEGFNDAQALPADGNDDMGPVASVYVVPKRWDDGDYTDTWRLVAVLEVEAGTMPNSYRNNLKIQNSATTAQYCFYLMKRSAGNNWQASVAGVVANVCQGADGGAKINDVAEETEPSTNKSDFPALVRFDQDQSGKPVIGVTCGEKTWCEIGRPNGVGNRRNPVHNGLANQTKKQKIKAWHDEQELTTDRMPPYHRAVRGSVTPDENLGGYTVLDFTDVKGAASAYVYLEAAPPAGSKYATWGLQQGNNTVTLFAQQNAAGDYDWWATFTPSAGAGNGVRFRVDQMVHGIKPPAVARWKWNPADEEIWVSCEQGCCTVSGNPTLVAIASHPLKPSED